MFWHYFKAGHFAADTTEQIVIMLNTGPTHGTRQGHAVSVQCQLNNVKYSANLKTCWNKVFIVFPCVAGSDTRQGDLVTTSTRAHAPYASAHVSLLVMSRGAVTRSVCINTPRYQLHYHAPTRGPYSANHFLDPAAQPTWLMLFPPINITVEQRLGSRHTTRSQRKLFSPSLKS